MLCRADLANLVNEAALLAGRQNKAVVEKIDFINAVERSIAVTVSPLCVCISSILINAHGSMYMSALLVSETEFVVVICCSLLLSLYAYIQGVI